MGVVLFAFFLSGCCENVMGCSCPQLWHLIPNSPVEIFPSVPCVLGSLVWPGWVTGLTSGPQSSGESPWISKFPATEHVSGPIGTVSGTHGIGRSSMDRRGKVGFCLKEESRTYSVFSP